MITPEQIATIRRLFFAEHWKVGTIAAELGLHHETVKATLATDSFRPAQPSPRERLTDRYLAFLNGMLAQYPKLRATRLFHMIRDRGYTGSEVQLRRVVAALRPRHREAYLRISVFPGEQAQADWASFGQVAIGRATRRLSCFLLTLSHSRNLWLEFFFDQSLENFLLGHIHAFQAWQGVPRNILYDNLKSVVLERLGDAIRFHPRILELAAHYHFAPVPCQVARGNEKGRVERAIQYVRHSFFAGRPFTTLADFNLQALRWRDSVASARPWPDDDRLTVQQAWQVEVPALLPLPGHPFDSAVRWTVFSRKTIYIRFDLNDYSIPPEAVGRNLTVSATPTEVRILDGVRLVARHDRSYDRHGQVNDPAHINALLREKRKAFASSAAARLLAAVPALGPFIETAMGRGEHAGQLSASLLRLLEKYGPDELAAAVQEAQTRQTPSTSALASLLARRDRARTAAPKPSIDLSRRPELANMNVQPHALEAYDDLAR